MKPKPRPNSGHLNSCMLLKSSSKLWITVSERGRLYMPARLDLGQY